MPPISTDDADVRTGVPRVPGPPPSLPRTSQHPASVACQQRMISAARCSLQRGSTGAAAGRTCCSRTRAKQRTRSTRALCSRHPLEARTPCASEAARLKHRYRTCGPRAHTRHGGRQFPRTATRRPGEEGRGKREEGRPRRVRSGEFEAPATTEMSSWRPGRLCSCPA